MFNITIILSIIQIDYFYDYIVIIYDIDTA